MSTSITKQGIIFADGESIGENLLNSSESNSTLIKNSSTGTESFEAAIWVGTLYGKTWMNQHLTVGNQYVLRYKVTCLSRPTGTFTGTETRQMPILVHLGREMNQSTSVIGGTKTTDIPEGESRIFITNFTFATISESNEYYGLCLYTMLFKSSSGNQCAKFRIEDLKLEEGSTPTPWTPNPNDAIYTGEHGFFEGSDIASIGKGYVSGREFYEM